jgi:hypothetical protein
MKKCCHFSTTNKASYNALLVALPIIAATGALLQIGGGCWGVAPYIVSLPESFFTSSYTVLYFGVIIID